MDSVLDCKYNRRFGVEIELNTFDNQNHRWDQDDDTPESVLYVADLLSKTLKERVEIQGWSHVHNNGDWIIKPDTSCGIEINTPVLKGWHGLKRLVKVTEAIGKSEIKAGKNCSFHVHVDISDLNARQLGVVIAYYIKCEHLFFDSVPNYRKNKKYCQSLAVSNMFDVHDPLEEDYLINAVSDIKYHSMNVYHFIQGGGFTDNERKATMEFRIAENTACVDPVICKNWIRFLLHFIESVKDRPMPSRYIRGNPKSGLLWLDLPDFLNLLNFDKPISNGLQQVKTWFLSRLAEHGYQDNDLIGSFSTLARSAAKQHFLELTKDEDLEMQPDENSLYEDSYIF